MSTRRPTRALAHGMLAAAALLLPWLASATDAAPQATVSVRADVEGPTVNLAVTRGFNFGNWMAMADFQQPLAKVPAASLRFPGGNIGDEQDMDAATLDTFKALLGLVAGAPELVIQTRVYGGRVDRKPANMPEDAAQAVKLARERGLQVGHWEIGNEPDLYSTVRGDPSWTPERYCEVFRSQARAVKAADPALRVAGPAVSGSHAKAMAFAERFIELCGDVVDLLTWHIYPTEGDGTDEAALATVSQVDESIERLRSAWRDPRRNPLGHRREIEFGVTEYGLSWKTDRPRFLADQTGALWAAEASLRMAQKGVRMAHYFAYQGTGFHGLLDNGGVARPSYYAFGMLSGLQGRFVKAESSQPRLWAHAVKSGDVLQLVLMNTQARPLGIEVDAAGWQVREARYFDAAIVDDEASPASLPAAQRLTLPARSMTLLQLQRAP